MLPDKVLDRAEAGYGILFLDPGRNPAEKKETAEKLNKIGLQVK